MVVNVLNDFYFTLEIHMYNMTSIVKRRVVRYQRGTVLRIRISSKLSGWQECFLNDPIQSSEVCPRDTLVFLITLYIRLYLYSRWFCRTTVHLEDTRVTVKSCVLFFRSEIQNNHHLKTKLEPYRKTIFLTEPKLHINSQSLDSLLQYFTFCVDRISKDSHHRRTKIQHRTLWDSE